MQAGQMENLDLAYLNESYQDFSCFKVPYAGESIRKSDFDGDLNGNLMNATIVTKMRSCYYHYLHHRYYCLNNHKHHIMRVI